MYRVVVSFLSAMVVFALPGRGNKEAYTKTARSKEERLLRENYGVLGQRSADLSVSLNHATPCNLPQVLHRECKEQGDAWQELYIGKALLHAASAYVLL